MIRVALACLSLVGAGSALADPAPAASETGEAAEPYPAEQYEELFQSFDELLGEAEQAGDEVRRLEAAEIAAIAEELSAEGDAEIAVALIEEAIRLLATADGD